MKSDGHLALAERHRLAESSAVDKDISQDGLRAIAEMTQWSREEEICSQEGAADYWYYVIAGAARKCLVRRNGQRQIVDLLLPGDFFGFTVEGKHRFSVQAITDGTLITRYPRQRVEDLADHNPLLAKIVREHAFETIKRLQKQLLIISRMTATEKVGDFLVEMSERLPQDARNGTSLPVSRYDIADHLGISVETVSRSITQLKERGSIMLGGPRRINIIDRTRFNGGTKNAVKLSVSRSHR